MAFDLSEIFMIMEFTYLNRYFERLRTPLPPGIINPPLPDPPPWFHGDPNPVPSSASRSRDVILGELLLNALGDPSPDPMKGSLVNAIRNEGVQQKVLEDLVPRFEAGAKQLKEELSALQNAKSSSRKKRQ